MKLLKAPDEGSPQFIVCRVKMPNTFCAYFGPNGEETFYYGPEVEREITLFIREKPINQIDKQGG